MGIELGKFIVLEGIDGAGTTTQADLLVTHLLKQGRQTRLTREPSTGPVGSLLRGVLGGRVVGPELDGEHLPIPNDVIALLFAGDRLDHLACEVDPALARGDWVVSDRYVHSSVIYQSVEGELDWIRGINSRARVADVCYVLELSAEQAAARRSHRGSEEIYEKLDFQRKVAEGYRRLPEIFPGQAIVMLDGSADTATVHAAILSDLTLRFG